MNISLSEITIYPVKSCGGIPLDSARLEPRGLQHDRRWMLVDADGMFMTQRDHPRMTLVQVAVKHDALELKAPGMEALFLPLESQSKELVSVTVWDDDVEAQVAGEEPSLWFSEYLGVACRLVVMSGLSLRPVDRNYAVHDDVVSFADAFPLLLISDASLADLNSRLDSPIPMKRFRPNLVVTGCEAYEEDTWEQIMIGETLMHVVKPCARCTITTVDTMTAEKSSEPLRTLAAYRAIDNKVMFGQNLIHEGTGTLKLGDTVHILKRKSPQ